eukprot:2911077-Amphidinium_carterae.1
MALVGDRYKAALDASVSPSENSSNPLRNLSIAALGIDSNILAVGAASHAVVQAQSNLTDMWAISGSMLLRLMSVESPKPGPPQQKIPAERQ